MRFISFFGCFLFIALFSILCLSGCRPKERREDPIAKLESFDTMAAMASKAKGLADIYKQDKAQPIYLIMIGAPGAGKGTQAGLLAQRYSVPHLSVGEILRAETEKANSVLGQKVAVIMGQGGLVPDEMVMEVLLHRVRQDDCKNGFILDGFPRTLPQAQMFDNIFKDLIGSVDIVKTVLYLKVRDEEVISRVKQRAICAKCNAGEIDHIQFNRLCSVCRGDEVKRSDDDENTMKKRLAVYHEQTEPVLQYYRNNSGCNMIEIDAMLGVQRVFQAITGRLDEIKESK